MTHFYNPLPQPGGLAGYSVGEGIRAAPAVARFFRAWLLQQLEFDDEDDDEFEGRTRINLKAPSPGRLTIQATR